MDDESVLERILNSDDEPTDLPLPLLQRITNDFSEDKKIGHGGFGEVYKGELQNGVIVAVKRMYVNENTVDDKAFRREIISLMNTNHQNVVRFLGFCSHTYHTSIKETGSAELNFVKVNERLLCSEYISNGSLDMHITDELRGLEWETRYRIIIGICKGLCYLHEGKNIVHMDLKPANILLDEHMAPKITDFGLSRSSKKSRTSGLRFGTRGYVAPEYEEHGKTSVRSDVYSLGAIINELVTGCVGVPNENNVLRRWRHRWSKPPTLLQYQQVTRCIDIAKHCRHPDPEHRPSISKIISTLTGSKSMDGHSNQISPCFIEDDMLGINPLELRIPCNLKDDISSFIVELTNDTRSWIAFNIELPSIQYIAQPEKGIMQPESKYGAKIIVQTRDVHEHDHHDKLIIQSRKLSDDQLRDKVNTESMFHEEAGQVVDEVSLIVVHEPIFRKRKHGSLLRKRACFSHHYPTNMKYLEEESDRIVDVTRGAMGSLLDKLGKVIVEDYNLEKSMKRDIESSSEELRKMHLELPKMEKLDGMKVWVNEVREMSYKIEDMVDSILVHVENEGIKLLQDGNNQIGDVIRDMKKKVHAMSEKYNSDVKNVGHNATSKGAIDHRFSATYNKKEQLIGIEEPRDKLIWLVEEDGGVSKQSLKIFSIVGMGGLGKTALANAVYDKLQAQYHARAFVTMGQNCDVKTVLKNILIECRKDATNLEHLDVRQVIYQLRELLKYKRYFIVIDDMWATNAWDPEAWDIIKSGFPRNNCGSRVIITTRFGNVGLTCCDGESKYVHVMNPLGDEDSRRLFFSGVFGSQESCPQELDEVSNDILRRCGGLPLAINSIASILAGDQQRSTWDNVCKNWGAMVKGNDLQKMKQMLDLNYIHLPDPLKPCLLYVGMYPDDQEIDKNDLLRQWVAEGFLHRSTNDGPDVEDVAELFFKVLLATYMIKPGKIDEYNGKVMSCRVHLIMLDLIRAKAAEENFIHVIDGSKNERCQIHRVSLHYNDKEDERILEGIKEGSLSHVRSVLFYRTSILPNFVEFKYVRVLHLEHKVPSIGGLNLTGINRLFLLRYLKITSTQSVYELKLPDRIGELQQLETIDLHNSSLKNYPSDIVSLPWLMHLISTGNNAGVVLPDGIEMLKSLRTLVGVDVVESSIKNIKGLGELTNLRTLQLCLGGIVEPTTMHMNALYSSIPMLSASIRTFTFERKWAIELDALGRSRTPLFPRGSYIGELDLGSFQFQRCPKWIGQLHRLYKFTISVREVDDGVSIVAGLPSLAYFHMSILNHNEHREESVVIPGGRAFQALKRLLFYCPKVSLTFEAGAMPQLEHLSIVLRYNMARQFLPVGIEHLPSGTLKEICLCVCPNHPSRMEDTPQVVGLHRTSLRLLLKEAFRPHHPAAQIFFVFDCVPILIEEEDNIFSKKEKDNLGVDDEEDYYSADGEGFDDEEYYEEDEDEEDYFDEERNEEFIKWMMEIAKLIRDEATSTNSSS